MNFSYSRRVAFSDTDAMGVTHHANYLRFCEEARVAWMRERGLSGFHWPHVNQVMAVLQYQIWHRKPCTFDDLIRIELQVRRLQLKIQFQYVMYKGDEWIAKAETWHVPVDQKLQPVRPTPQLRAALEGEKWTETWLSSL
jgi:acyl-CoA thioester hydrolase